MKKIIPFSNTLNFKTNVSEITAISLEHQVNKEKDAISGVFNISGYYKMLDASIEPTPFKFELPFDIALGTKYDIDTLKVDIDDFRYELKDNSELKVNIDLLLDGKEEPIIEETKEPIIEETRETNLLEEMIESKEEIKEPSEEDTNRYVTYRVYRVNQGDTIESITTKYGITKEELLDYNSDLDNIKPGDKLIIQSKNA